MANHMSLYDQAVRALMWHMRAELACERINDYGEVTGIREEIDQLHRDAEHAFTSIEKRAWNLTNKADKYNEPTQANANKEDL